MRPPFPLRRPIENIGACFSVNERQPAKARIVEAGRRIG